MEPVVTLVGFLGAGKTTLLKYLVASLLEKKWNPYIILNDYIDAELDARQISQDVADDSIYALTGSCICCDGINELRECVNDIPKRKQGITLVEANGTSDASTLMGFLGVGLKPQFMPPIQISVIDAKNWQRRKFYNQLESEQLKVASLVVLTHLDKVSLKRLNQVRQEVNLINPFASIVTQSEIVDSISSDLKAIPAMKKRLDHRQSHWSSCSVDLPDLPSPESILDICNAIPNSIVRIKGCTRLANDNDYTYFERCPDGEIYMRPYSGTPVTGSKLLTVGPGSHPELLQAAVNENLVSADLKVNRI